MNNISEFLSFSFAACIFCLGIYLFMIGINEYNAFLDKAIDSYGDEDFVSYVPYKREDEVYYTKGQILTLLFEPLDYDIQIDSYLIKKQDHDKSKIKNYIFLNDYYIKHYIYDFDGNISRIEYRSA